MRWIVLLLYLLPSVLWARPKVYSPALEDKASSYFSFSFFKDNFNYQDSAGVFQQTFRDSDEANFPFMMLFQFAHPFYNGAIDVGITTDFGFSYNSGKGYFSSAQTLSDTNLTVWLLPLEVGLFCELDLKYVIFSVAAGPSVAGLIQNRSDYDDDEEGKNLRQWGYGYFTRAEIKFNLNRIFKKNAFKLFRNYEATRLTLDFMVHHVDYSNFKDDISIEGDSYGVGFTFDFY